MYVESINSCVLRFTVSSVKKPYFSLSFLFLCVYLSRAVWCEYCTYYNVASFVISFFLVIEFTVCYLRVDIFNSSLFSFDCPY